MATLEEQRNALKARLAGRPDEPNDSFGSKVSDEVFNAVSQFNIGLAQLFGMPGDLSNLLRQYYGYEEKSALPTSKDIQKKMADFNMTYRPGEQRDTVVDRFFQNVGAASIPVAGIASKTGQVAKVMGTELASSLGAAGGGRIAESTEVGQRHPEAARAVGELIGGFGAPTVRLPASPKELLKLSPTNLAYSQLSKPFKGKQARDRAVARLYDLVENPEQALKNIERFKDTPLTPVQASGEPGLMSLHKRLFLDNAKFRKKAQAQHKQVTTDIKKQFRKGVSPAKARQAIVDIFDNAVKTSEAAMLNVATSGTKEDFSRLAANTLDDAYGAAREVENIVWQRTKKGDQIVPENTLKTYKSILGEFTKGADPAAVPKLIKQKLGRINKKGNLVGGQFVNGTDKTADAKELHQFSSAISDLMRTLAKGDGTANQLRILGKLKSAVLSDMSLADTSGAYKEAISISKDLNDRFTKGNVGKIMGFNRGQATNESLVLDRLLGAGGEQARLNLAELERISPGLVDTAQDFVKANFAKMVTKDGRVVRSKYDAFVNKYANVLDAMPQLKTDLHNAAVSQKELDNLLGATDTRSLSNAVREKSTAAMFLNADPGDEMKNLLRYGAATGTTERRLKELVELTKQDKTGDALRGLGTAMKETLLAKSRTADGSVNGERFLKELRKVSRPALRAGVLSKKDVAALNKVGTVYQRLFEETTAVPVTSLMTDEPGLAIDLLGRVAGAKAGAALSGGGASIQTAAIGSSLGRKLIGRVTRDEALDIIEEALTDRDLMRSLLKDVKKFTPRDESELVDRLLSKGQRAFGRGKRTVQDIIRPRRQPVTAPVAAATGVDKETRLDIKRNELRKRLQLLR